MANQLYFDWESIWLNTLSLIHIWKIKCVISNYSDRNVGFKHSQRTNLVKRNIFLDFDRSSDAPLDVVVQLLERLRNKPETTRNVGPKDTFRPKNILLKIRQHLNYLIFKITAWWEIQKILNTSCLKVRWTIVSITWFYGLHVPSDVCFRVHDVSTFGHLVENGLVLVRENDVGLEGFHAQQRLAQSAGTFSQDLNGESK